METKNNNKTGENKMKNVINEAVRELEKRYTAILKIDALKYLNGLGYDLETSLKACIIFNENGSC